MKQYNQGQSLIETIIAVSIITTVIIAILGLVTNLLVVSGSSKFKTQASFLAQEAQETVHSIRDTNKLKVRIPWDTRFYVQGSDWYKIKYPYNATEGWELESQMNEEAARETINLDGVNFTRTIKVVKYQDADNKREVTVKVTWPEKDGINQVEVSSILTAW